MLEKMSKGKKLAVLVALLLTNIAVMGDNIIYPITNSIYGEFYGVSAFWTNYVVSGPLIVIFVVSLIAPKLLEKMSQKTMMLIGGVLFAASTIFGVIVPSVMYMAAMRTIMGVGQAFVNVAAMSEIAALYTDEGQSASTMGMYNTAMTVVGIVFGLLSGALAVNNWRNAYYVYLSAVLMLILIVLFIPDLGKTAGSAPAEKKEKGAAKRLPVLFWIGVVTFMIISVCFNMMAFYVSFYVEENGMGTSAVAGIMSTMISVGSMLFCIVFGKVYGKMGKQTMTVAVALLALALVLLRFVPNPFVTVVALLCVGASYGGSLTYCYAIGPELAPESADSAIGIVTAAYAITGFVSTYIVTWLMNVMHTDGAITPVLIVPMVIMIAALVIYPFFAKSKKG